MMLTILISVIKKYRMLPLVATEDTKKSKNTVKVMRLLSKVIQGKFGICPIFMKHKNVSLHKFLSNSFIFV